MNIRTLIENELKSRLSKNLSEGYDDRVNEVRKELDKEPGVTKSNIDSVIEKIARRKNVLEFKGSSKAKNDFIKDVKKGYKFEKKDRNGFTSSMKKDFVSDFKSIRTPSDLKRIFRKAEDNNIMANSYDFEEDLLNLLAKEAREKTYLDFIAKKLENDFLDAVSNSFPDGDPIDSMYTSFKPWLFGNLNVGDVADVIAKRQGSRTYSDYMHSIWKDQYKDAESDYNMTKRNLEKKPGDRNAEYAFKQAKERLEMLKANKH